MGPTQERMKRVLITCARMKRTLTYSALGIQFGMYPRSPVLAAYLGQIGEDCKARGEPVVNCLCVTEDTGFPGEGYYKFRGTYGLPRVYAEWRKDVQDCYNFKWNFELLRKE